MPEDPAPGAPSALPADVVRELEVTRAERDAARADLATALHEAYVMRSVYWAACAWVWQAQAAIRDDQDLLLWADDYDRALIAAVDDALGQTASVPASEPARMPAQHAKHPGPQTSS